MEDKNIIYIKLASVILDDMDDYTRLPYIFLEKGKYNPLLKLAFEIAEALNTKIDEIFYYEKNKNIYYYCFKNKIKGIYNIRFTINEISGGLLIC